MNRECEKVREALLDMAYADPSAAEGNAKRGGAGGCAGTSAMGATRASMGDAARHLEGCSECRDYAGALADIAVALPAQRDDGAVGGVSPDWARLSSTIERGVRLRTARERRAVALFALTASGILAAMWIPLLARSPQALLTLQAVGSSGIALFYLPIHVFRERKGDKA